MENLLSNIDQASVEGKILESASINIREFLEANSNEFYIDVIQELFDKGLWEELNDRFYKKLSFGTGGLRGRTIGRNISDHEKEKAAPMKGLSSAA